MMNESNDIDLFHVCVVTSDTLIIIIERLVLFLNAGLASEAVKLRLAVNNKSVLMRN